MVGCNELHLSNEAGMNSERVGTLSSHVVTVEWSDTGIDVTAVDARLTWTTGRFHSRICGGFVTFEVVQQQRMGVHLVRVHGSFGASCNVKTWEVVTPVPSRDGDRCDKQPLWHTVGIKTTVVCPSARDFPVAVTPPTARWPRDGRSRNWRRDASEYQRKLSH